MSLIAGITGTIAGKGNGVLYISLGGMTFSVHTTLPAYTELRAGDSCSLHTHLIVREDDLILYGFPTELERDVFVKLLSVSGVGAKSALALLSAQQPDLLCAAIAQGDTVRLTRAPGVGQKLAQRLILELKGQVDRYLTPQATTDAAPEPAADDKKAVFRMSDAIEALTGLGYSVSEAEKAVRAVPNADTLSLDDIILKALRALAR